MARARTLKPGFFKNDKLAELPIPVRVLFAGLWTLADRSGRLEDRPKRIAAEIFPYDPEMDVDSMLNVLDKAEFIFRYILNESSYIQIPKWFSHQKPHPHEQDSTIPPIPLDLTDFEGCRDFARTSRDISRQVRNLPGLFSVPSFNPIPPIVPLAGDGSLPTNPDPKRRARKSVTSVMTPRQSETYQTYLSEHPKNTIQIVSSRKLWIEKVHDQATVDFLMGCLRREKAGDTTFMLGPGKWLAEHLELYASGVKPAKAAGKPDVPEYRPPAEWGDAKPEDMTAEERAAIQATFGGKR
jgi:hypothetical protein